MTDSEVPIFELPDFDAHSRHGEKLFQLIYSGALPRETTFKLAAIGHNETTVDGKGRLLWTVVSDLIRSAGDPEKMSPETRMLVEGDMPDAVIDLLVGYNAEARHSFEHMYYSVGDLQTIMLESTVSGELEADQRWVIAKSAARSLWRKVISRSHPEWLTNPAAYCPPTIGHYTNEVRYPSERLARRRNIARAVLSDPLVLDLYTEAVDSKIKGIGPKGKESLRLLLSEEHPELA